MSMGTLDGEERGGGKKMTMRTERTATELERLHSAKLGLVRIRDTIGVIWVYGYHCLLQEERYMSCFRMAYMIGKAGSKDPWEDIDRVVGEVVVVREPRRCGLA